MYVVDLVVEAWIRVGGGGNIRKKIALDFLYSNNEVKFHIFCFPTHLQHSNSASAFEGIRDRHTVAQYVLVEIAPHFQLQGPRSLS